MSLKQVVFVPLYGVRGNQLTDEMEILNNILVFFNKSNPLNSSDLCFVSPTLYKGMSNTRKRGFPDEQPCPESPAAKIAKKMDEAKAQQRKSGELVLRFLRFRVQHNMRSVARRFLNSGVVIREGALLSFSNYRDLIVREMKYNGGMASMIMHVSGVVNWKNKRNHAGTFNPEMIPMAYMMVGYPKNVFRRSDVVWKDVFDAAQVLTRALRVLITDLASDKGSKDKIRERSSAVSTAMTAYIRVNKVMFTAARCDSYHHSYHSFTVGVAESR
jgi:hypothetical protein